MDRVRKGSIQIGVKKRSGEEMAMQLDTLPEQC